MPSYYEIPYSPYKNRVQYYLQPYWNPYQGQCPFGNEDYSIPPRSKYRSKNYYRNYVL